MKIVQNKCCKNKIVSQIIHMLINEGYKPNLYTWKISWVMPIYTEALKNTQLPKMGF